MADISEERFNELIQIMKNAQEEIGYPVIVGLPLPVVFKGDKARVMCTELTFDEWRAFKHAPERHVVAGRLQIGQLEKYKPMLIQFGEALEKINKEPLE